MKRKKHEAEVAMANHICPWWLGYFLINPFRKTFQSPEKILKPYIKPGMTVLEIGPGMGYFSLWMARTVGETGKVLCVDVQQKMIRALERRATKAGVDKIIDARVCGENNLGLGPPDGGIDFCLAFAVVHEIGDASGLFKQIRGCMNAGATCLLAEPRGHVRAEEFDLTTALAEDAGFTVVERLHIWRSRAVLLKAR